MRPFVLALALSWPLLAGAETVSPYAGMEGREIKALSETDIEELRLGGGWGMALAAELNGAPGTCASVGAERADRSFGRTDCRN